MVLSHYQLKIAESSKMLDPKLASKPQTHEKSLILYLIVKGLEGEVEHLVATTPFRLARIILALDPPTLKAPSA